MKYFVLITCTIFFLNTASAQYNKQSFATTEIGLLNGVSVFTVEFWVKTTESGGSNVYWQRPCLFGNETSGDNSGDFGIVTNFGYIGMWEGISSRNTDQQFLSNNVRINDNQWHHIAAVNNGQSVNLYVDGNIVGSIISGKPLNTTRAPLTFGAASLDHNFAGNLEGNINFVSQSTFGEARISKGIRYGARFIPSQTFTNDGFTLASFHFNDRNHNNNDRNNNNNNDRNYNDNDRNNNNNNNDRNNNNQYNNNNNNQYNNNPNYNNNNQPYNNQRYNQYYDPNEPVTFDPSEPINDNAAKQATLFVNETEVLNGRLLLGKKDWSLSSEIYIRFFEDNSRKVKYYKPEEIKGFKMGDSYYEPKFLAQGGSVSTPSRKTMVKRLTPEGSRMGMYQYTSRTSTKNSSGGTEYKTTVVYFVQLPHSTDDKIYQFGDNKFTPKFDTRVSALVADNPALAEKIRNKDKNYFYAFVTDEKHQLNVWWNIVNEYNK